VPGPSDPDDVRRREPPPPADPRARASRGGRDGASGGGGAPRPGDAPPPPGDAHPLGQARAAFVTWRRRADGALRGCRGEVRAARPLYLSIFRQAVAAAVDDPRFPPVTAAEQPGLSVHISALTDLSPIDPAGIEPGRHGLLIRRGGRSGLLLPRVPALHDIRTPGAFLEALCRKAGLPPDAWRAPDAALLAFESEDWGEDEEGGGSPAGG
jgi:AmmeMemoRadiSam system protein A